MEKTTRNVAHDPGDCAILQFSAYFIEIFEKPNMELLELCFETQMPLT